VTLTEPVPVELVEVLLLPLLEIDEDEVIELELAPDELTEVTELGELDETAELLLWDVAELVVGLI
jgi:hypothetical protein